MPVPKGLTKCAVCGEYKGTVKGRELGRFWKKDDFVDDDMKEFLEENHVEENDQTFTVRCLCDGILCSRCHKNKIHRPISNSYCEESNTIEHWPYFTVLMPCRECSHPGQTHA